jgi:CheY-like chemotaxis protein
VSAIAFAEGNEALAYLRETDDLPELILLDVVMAGLNAWGFRAEQLKDARLASIPVTLISTSREIAAHARALRADGFLQKPFDAQQLLDVVAQHRSGPTALPA